MLYDPPSGWKYGFPKAYKPLPNETVKETLIRDGYPANFEDYMYEHVRFIGTPEEFQRIQLDKTELNP